MAAASRPTASARAGQTRAATQGAVIDGDPLRAGAGHRGLLPVGLAQPHHARRSWSACSARWAARGRKSVILVSEGFIYDPQPRRVQDVVQSSRRGNAAIYFLDTEGWAACPSIDRAVRARARHPGPGRRVHREPRRAPRARSRSPPTAAASGARTPTTSAKGITRIADETRAYYLVGYIPTNTARDGSFRKIQVRSAREGRQGARAQGLLRAAARARRCGAKAGERSIP